MELLDTPERYRRQDDALPYPILRVHHLTCLVAGSCRRSKATALCPAWTSIASTRALHFAAAGTQNTEWQKKLLVTPWGNKLQRVIGAA